LPATTVEALLAPLAAEEPPVRLADPTPETWRERLWRVPAETRLGVREFAEAMGRPKSWVYRRTSERSEKAPLPH